MEVAFVNRGEREALPKRGILAAPDFPINVVRAAGPYGGRDLPSLLKSMAGSLVVWPNAFLAGPVLGAPMAVMALEEMVRLGAEEILFLGSAGCLSDKWDIGTIFCPSAGISTEGTSPHYPAPLEADADLCARVAQAAAKSGIDMAAPGSVIWSTDGIYRETAELIARQKAAGADAVEMECTALFAAGNFRGVKVAAILAVSDQIVGREHRTGFHHRVFKDAVKSAAQLAWQAILGTEL